jgi:glycosyltransferase involved in cell wall biosynthesis
MNDINLSYVLTTYNKLPYLKMVMDDLIKSCEKDEEIIVTDGGSTDGTKEYLQELYALGKIHKYISEKDLGEGHGFNKGIMMAGGKLIKLLSDDDVFFYDAIRKCKEYMLLHPEIDVLNTHGGWYDLSRDNDIAVFTEIYLTSLKQWKETGKPFAFCTLGIMLKKNSLPLLGLFNPSIARADAEYSLRITSLKIRLAWYTGVSYVRILNNDSNSVIHSRRIQEETMRLNEFYNVSIDGEQAAASITDMVKSSLRRYKNRLLGNRSKKYGEHQANVFKHSISFDKGVEKSYKWMQGRFSAFNATFHTN